MLEGERGADLRHEDAVGNDVGALLDGPGRREAERLVEALVMVSAEPVPTAHIARLLGLPPSQAESLCRGLSHSYETQRRGFCLAEVAGGWRFQSHPDMKEALEDAMELERPGRLSPAALETLAVVAYRQPVTRAQVSVLRGVDSDGVLRSLCQRGLVAAVGKDDGPGQAVLFATTNAFLEQLGLAGIEELPPIGAFVPPAEVVETLEERLRGR